jgi:hypothetical protein
MLPLEESHSLTLFSRARRTPQAEETPRRQPMRLQSRHTLQQIEQDVEIECRHIARPRINPVPTPGKPYVPRGRTREGIPVEVDEMHKEAGLLAWSERTKIGFVNKGFMNKYYPIPTQRTYYAKRGVGVYCAPQVQTAYLKGHGIDAKDWAGTVPFKPATTPGPEPRPLLNPYRTPGLQTQHLAAHKIDAIDWAEPSAAKTRAPSKHDSPAAQTAFLRSNKIDAIDWADPSAAKKRTPSKHDSPAAQTAYLKKHGVKARDWADTAMLPRAPPGKFELQRLSKERKAHYYELATLKRPWPTPYDQHLRPDEDKNVMKHLPD